LSSKLFSASIAMQVPLVIEELKSRGGPGVADYKRAGDFGPLMAQRGDLLMYSTKQGVRAKFMNELCFAVAVLSFVPGGVDFFNIHFEAGQA
jgi:hypothetical protein